MNPLNFQLNAIEERLKYDNPLERLLEYYKHLPEQSKEAFTLALIGKLNELNALYKLKNKR